MASFVYTNAKRAFLAGELNLASNDIRAMLVMANTTADTDKDVATIGAITTLDEMDGAGYARVALTGEAVSADNANDRGEFTADDIVFQNVSAGTRSVAAVVLYKHVTNDTDSIPLAYIDTASGITFPITPNGGDLRFAASAAGLIGG